MAINRTRYIERDFAGVGSEESAALGAVLAQLLGPEALEALVHRIASLHEDGGELYIGAHREKLDKNFRPTEHNDPEGRFTTVGYLFGYNSRAQIKGQIEEPDVPYGTVAAPPLEVPADEPASEEE